MIEQITTFLATPSGFYIGVLIAALLVNLLPKFRFDPLLIDNVNVSVAILFIGSLNFLYTVVSPENGLQNILNGIATYLGIGSILVPIVKEVYM